MAKVVHPLSKQGGGPVKIRPGLTVEQFGKRLPGACATVPHPVPAVIGARFICSTYGAGKPSAEVERLFVLLDKDVNGRLTPNEMRPMAAFANEL